MTFLLLRVPSLKSPACIFRRRPYLPRVPSLIAASPERVHSLRRMPCPRFVPSSGFRNLSTVSSALRLRRLVSSRSHVQGCRRSGASLPAQRCWLNASPFPRAVVIQSPHRSLPGNSLSRLARRRMPRSGCLDFEALLRARQRCVRFGVSLPAARSPLRFFLLQVVNHRLGFGLPKTSRSRRCLPGLLIPLDPSSACFSGELDFLVSLEINLPETFEPSD